ncbi:MAG: FAD binding domain-containing protein [Spirochaetota bacterium]
MSTITWVQPESLDELRAALRDGARLHGGGTGLMRNPPARGSIADLSLLGIDGARANGTSIQAGGAASIATVVRETGRVEPGHIVVQALSRMAAPALRNRITLGGSVALFPPWSSVVGPLLAAGTRLTLVGAHEATVGLEEYLERRQLRRGTAIVDIEIALTPGLRSSWFAFTRTRFTYPLFAVAVAGRCERAALTELRVVVTGSTGRYTRLWELEERLVGSAIPPELSADDPAVRIPTRQGYSGDYLTRLATIQIRRGIALIASADPDEAVT